MPTRSLPARPSLEQLKKQAKELLKAHQVSDPEVVPRLRDAVPRLAEASDSEILNAKISLRDAQRVVAVEYGYKSWQALKDEVDFQQEDELLEAEVDRVLTSPNIRSQRIVILRIKNADRSVPIWVGESEGNSIALTLQNKSVERPLTHDLLDSTIADLGATVSQVVITELNDNTYYAKIVLLSNGTRVERDSRPSDAMALAVRGGTPIFVSAQVAEAAALDIDPKSGLPSKEEVRSKSPKLYESWKRYFPDQSRLSEWEPAGLPEEMSEHARQTVSLARDEALILTRGEIGTEHLLLALLLAPDERLSQFFLKQGANYDAVAYGIKLLAGDGIDVALEEIALSDQASAAIELANEEAHELGQKEIGQVHLILGLLREGGTAARLLATMEIDLDSDLPPMFVPLVMLVRQAQGRDLGASQCQALEACSPASCVA